MSGTFASVNLVNNPDNLVATLVYGANSIDVVITNSTTTALATSANPSVFGQSVTFTATVSTLTPGVTPTGTVNFLDNGSVIGSGTLDGSGVATFTTSGLSVSSHPITAAYLGDSVDQSSTSTTTNQVVNQDTTTTSLSSTTNPSVYGQSVTITATVAPDSPGGRTLTGTVQFYDNGTPLGSAVPLVGGHANLDATGFSVATHPIIAVYSGDGNFVTSTSSTLNQVVNKDSTTTTIATSANPILYGSMEIITATVAVVGPGVSTPSGTVQFYDNGTAVGSPVAVVAGQAILDLSTFAVGTHPITAVYSGDTHESGSSSNEIDEVIQATTTTVVDSSANPSVYGQSVTFTATVAAEAVPGAGTPTGTVIFYDNGVAITGSVALVGGVATFTTSGLPVGSHPITAAYSGDTTDQSSSSSAVDQTVNQASTSTTVTSVSSNPSLFGESVTFTATVTPVSPGGGERTGTVQFQVDGSDFGSPVTVSGGQADLTTSALLVGTHSVVAIYSGDSNNVGSTSSAYSQEVDPDHTSTAVTASHNPSPYGELVTFTATVLPIAPGSGTPTGTIQFKVDGSFVGSPFTMSGGEASFTPSPALSVGAHTIVAIYSGDTNNETSTSPDYSQTVTKATTTTTVDASPIFTTEGQDVTFTATVAVVSPGAGTPGGSVEFFADGTSLGSAPLDGMGQATIDTSSLSVAIHSITAVYSGDGNDFGSDNTASPLSYEVKPVPTTVYVNGTYLGDPYGTPVTIGSDTHYVGYDAFGTIQEGIDAVASGGTVNVAAGKYIASGNFVNAAAGVVDGISIDKPLSLLGPLVGFNPNTDPTPPAADQAIVMPGTSDPNPFDSTAFSVIGISASGVTIKGMTIDGSNDTPGFAHYVDPNTGNPVTFNGVTIDASEGISSYVDVGSITLENNVITHTAYTGIDFQNGPAFSGAPTNGNTISQNLIQDLGGGGYRFGIGVVLYDNFYANVTENVLANVDKGVQTGNFYAADTGDASADANIANNAISAYRTGIFYNLMYGDSSPFTVDANTITAVNDPADGGSNWDGFLISSLQGSVTATFAGNTIDGSAGTSYTNTSGYNVWNDTTLYGVTLDGGTVTGVGYGVWVNNYDGYSSPASGATSVEIEDMAISHTSVAGVYVKDNPLDTNHDAVLAELCGCTTITTSPIGALVTGASASLLDDGATIDGGSTSTGILVDAGNALIQYSNLSGNRIGIQVQNGATVDAGDLTGTGSGFTGLGVSAGSNILQGYTGQGDALTGSHAIVDLNTTGQPDVMAQNNDFGQVVLVRLIGNSIYDHADDASLTTVDYSSPEDVQPAATDVYVDQAWAGSALGAAVGSGHTFGVDAFATIQDGIDAVASSGTVHIDNGTYAESNLLITNPMTIVGESKGGVIITPAFADSHTDSNFGGTASNGFIINASNVTIESLTIDGGAGLNYRNAIITYSSDGGSTWGTFDNVTVDNVSIKNIFRKGVGLYTTTGESTGDAVTNSDFDNIGTAAGVAYEATYAIAAFQTDATISNNTITNSAAGIGVNSFDGVHSPLVNVTGNHISLPSTVLTSKGALGMDLASLADGSSVSGNDVDLTGDATDDVGIVISFDQGQVTVSGNTVTGKDGDVGILLYQDTASATPVNLQGNSVTVPNGSTSTGTGILLTDLASDTSRFSDVPGAVYATLTGNTVTGFATGVSLAGGSDAVVATLGDGTPGGSNAISGATTGLWVSGAGASATVNVSSISGSSTGITFTNGAAGSVAGVDFDGTSNGTDLWLTTTAGAVTVGAGNAFFATDYYVLNQSSNAIDLSGNGTTFNGSGVTAATPLSTLFAIQDEIVDALDSTSYGLVRIVAGHLYVTQSDESGLYGGAGAINRAVAAASANDAINFAAGTYVATGFYVNATAGIASNLLIDKPLTLLGPLADAFDPNSPPDPSEQAIIEPGASDPNISDATALTVIGVNSSGVIIQGLTIRGSNDVTPGFVHSSPAITFQGVTIDAAEGISSYVDVGSITLENNIIEYTAYSGADFQNGPAFSGAPTNGNTISNNLIRNLGGNSWGIGVILYDNFYANVTDNVISNVRVGVQTGNFYAADAGNPSVDATISNNDISSYRRGIYYNLMYGSSSPFSVSDNHLTAVTDPTGNSTAWFGIYILSLQQSVPTSFTGNIIDATGAGAFTTTAGYELWNDTTTAGVNVSGGSVTGAQYGVLATNYDTVFGAAGGAETATISGVAISGASLADIYVQDSPSDTNRHAVSVTVNGGGTLTGSAVGVLVDGGHATATLNGASISDNTTGIQFTNGGSGSLNNVNFAGLTSNDTDLRIDTSAGAVTVGAGNAFDASVYTIDNRSPQGIDATQNTFGGIDPASATLGQLFDIDDQIIDALDNAAYGLVRVNADNIYVTQLSGSIQRGITAASAGDTVHVQAGTYSENLTINKSLTIIGGGSSTSGTVLVANSGNAIAITSDNVTLQSLRVNATGGTNGVYFNSAVSNETLFDLVVTGASNSDLEIANSAVVTNLSLDNVSLINAQVGLRTATTGVVHGLTVSNSHFDNDTYGFYTNANSGSTSNQNDVTNVNVTNTTFNNDLTKGIYVEAIDSATFDGITVSGSGTAGTSPEGIDINLKYGTYTGGIAFTNTTVLNSGAGTGAAFMIDIRNDSPSYSTNPASISSITLSNVSITGGPIGLSIGDNASGISLSGVQIHGSNIGMVDFITHPGTLNLGDTSFDGSLSTYIVNGSAFGIDATNGATFAGFDAGTGDPSNPADLASYFATEDEIYDAIDASGVGLVRLRAGHVFVTPNSYLNAGAPFTTTAPSIQRGIDAASGGDTVHVQAGTYPGGIVANKSVTVLGQGSGTDGTVVSLSSGNGIEIAADGVALQSLRIAGTAATNGVYINSNVDSDSLTDVVATGNSVGLELHNGVISNLSLDSVSLINGTTGLRASTTVQVHTLTVTNSHFDSNNIGFYTNATSSRTTNNADFTNVTISDSTFDNDAYKGIYVEKLDHATLDGIEVDHSGTVVDAVNFPSPAGIDINLKYGTYSNITIQNATITDSGTSSATAGNGLTLKGRDDAPSYNSNPASLTGVSLSNVTISGSPIDLALGNNVSGVSMSGVSLNGGYAGQSVGLVDYITAGPLNIADTAFDSALNGYIINTSTFGIDATGHATFNGFDTSIGDPTNQLATYFAIEDKIADAIDQSGVGLVRLIAGHVFVTQNSFGFPFTTTGPDIQRGIDAATDGDTIHVQGGSTTYVGSHVLNINKNVNIVGSTDNFNPTIFLGTVSLSVDLSNVTFSYIQFTNNTTSYIHDGAPGTLLTTGLSGVRSLSNVTFSHDLFAFTGTTAPNSDYALVNFWDVAVAGANGLQFTNTTFSTGDPTGGNGPAAATMWLQGSGGPIMFDGVTNEGHYTNGSHKMGSQINIGFGTNVTLKNSLTDDGGNFYLSGMSGVSVFNNDFLQSGFALNGVQNATVHDNTFENISNAIDASGGGENRAIVLKDAWGTPGLDHVQIYNNKFSLLTIPAVLLNQFTDPNTGDPVTPSASTYNDVNVYNNDFSGVSGVPAVQNVYNTVTINAANNYWGSPYGPTTAANPGGDGASVSDNVTFTPWIGLVTDGTTGGLPGFTPTNVTQYAVPTKLVFSTPPSSSARHGVPFDTQPVVTAVDANGILGINFDSSRVPGSQVALTLNAGSYTGTLAGGATVNATDGVVSFSGLNITHSGTYTLTADAQGSTWTGGLAIASTTSDPINVVQEATTTTLTASPNPSDYGQTVTFTATVATVNGGVATPTGNVTFKDGSTVLGTVALDLSGIATFTYSTLSVGSHSITAVYAGDTDDTGSTSDPVNQVINQDTTTTTLTGSPASPTVYGQSITFTGMVAVVAPGVGVPTGTVTVKDGTTTLGTASLDGTGAFTFSYSTLGVGAHSITAVYGGDTNDLTSTSPVVSRTVNKDQTQTTLISSANPSVHGQSVTFTATVIAKSPGVNTPTGTVVFLDSGTPIGTASLNASGVATFTTSNLSTATHSITATYGGDSKDLASSSSAVSQVVNKDSTTTGLISSLNPSLYGQSVTYTATVAPVSPGTGVPTGTVTFKDGATTIGTGMLNGSGVATFSISTTAIGSHSITAVYGGDTNDNGSTSSALTQIVQDTTTTAVTSAPNPSAFGQSVTLTATVTATANPGAVTPTGTVTFKDGSTTLGTGTLDGSGLATLSISTLSVSTHSITAVYGGDTYNQTSTSAAASQVVNKDSTTTTVAASPNPSAFGQSVTFTATVVAVAPGVNIPTGTVTFFDGATSLGTGTLDANGVATLSTSNLSVATHSITASYGGDGNDTASTSSAVSQVVSQANTTTTLTPAPNPSVYGQSVTLTATVQVVSPGVSTPTGTVTFYDGATSLGSAPVDGTGHASISTASFSVATHSLTAVYSGDTNDAGSTSSAVNQVVNRDDTTTTLAAAPNPSVSGQSVTLTATVLIVDPGAGTPTGTVTFFDGATSLGSSPLDGTGHASISTASLSVATHSLTAVYSGDTNDNGSTSDAVSQVVNQDTTTTTLIAAPNPSVYGQSVTLTATVSVAAPGSGTPTGTVNFYDGATLIGSGSLDGSGHVAITTSDLSVAAHPLTAVYVGDTNDAGSASDVVNQVVNQASTTTTLAAAPNPSPFGDSVTFTATVSAVAPGGGVPSGTVTFKDGTTAIGTGTLDGSGVATFSTSALDVGAHTITVVYDGTASHASSTSNAVSQIVQNTTTTTLDSSVNPSVFGQSVTFTATVTPAPVAGAVTPTGTVSFYEGATLLGTDALDGSGIATFSTSDLSVADHTITAVYNADTYNTGSTSNDLTQTVNQDDTSTTLTSSDNPSYFGESIMFAATVTATAPGVGTPTGTVIFFGDSTIIGFATLDGSGVATLTLSDLSVGTHPITALYAGDTNDQASSSDELDQTVNQDVTTTALAASPNPSVYGQSVTFTATVTANLPGVNIPTGSVTFMDGSTPLDTVDLDENGVATLSISTLAVGSHSITAEYSGDTNDDPSTSSPPVNQVVQNTTTTTLGASPNPSVFGQSVTFTATVVGASVPGAVIPTGTVTFFDGATNIGTGTLNGSGVATLSLSSLLTGTHSISAVYGGDIYDLTSTSNTVSQVVNKATSTTVESSASDNPSVFGQSISVTATVSPVSPGGGIPTGSVTFFDGATSLGTFTLSAGQATLTTASLSVGSHAITAVYSGDANDLTSTSDAYTQVVNKDNTTTVLTSSINPSSYRLETVTFTATIGVTSPGVSVPTGSVNFYDNGALLGSGTVSTTGGVTTATYSTDMLFVGSHPITAIYSGDGNNLTSTSNQVNQVVYSLNHQPTATSQSITVATNGVTSVTLHGSDVETVESDLVFTITSLPSSGTLLDSNGNAVTLGETFVGAADTLTYILPGYVLGDFSNSFTYTATDNGYPAGSGYYPLTSDPATATISTPAGSAGVLRISATMGSDTITISQTGSNALHVVLNGSTPFADTPIASLTAVQLLGLNGDDTYNVSTAIGVPVTVATGSGTNAATTVATNLTFIGGTGSNTVTATTTAGADSVNLSPNTGTVSGAGYTITLNNASSIIVNANSSVSANLFDSSGNDSFTATPTVATLSGTGFSNRVNNAGVVRARSTAGGSDTATLSDVSGSNVFSSAPSGSQFFGTGFYNQAIGFAAVTANAHSGTTDTAYLYDASGSNAFVATPTSASFTGAGLSETANGFSKFYGFAASGTTDSATLSDTSGSNTFTASPGYANFQGTGFYESAYGFASVTANAHSGTTDAANLSDASGSNTFTVSPTTATFIGTGLSQTANGFARVVATAANGTSDSATLSDGSGANSFTATPTSALFVGTTFHYEANKFASVTGIAHSGTSDTARLYDASGSNSFTATPTTASFTGTGLSLGANGFAKVIATAAGGTTDSATLSDTGGSNTFTAAPTSASFIGTGFSNNVMGFASVTGNAAVGANDAANLSDTAGSNTFTVSATTATFFGSGMSETANGFGRVVATAANGTSDSATLSDGSGANSFTATPTSALFVGTTFHYEANKFASVTGIAHSGTSDTARLYDASGSNSFTATPTTASFTGTGLSLAANGFAKVIAAAASGTTDSAALSDTSGSNTFNASPGSASFVGTSFFNLALGFTSATANAAAGTSDTATLADVSGSNIFTSSPTSASFTGVGLSLTANGFKKVTATAASGTTDTANFSDSVSKPGAFTGAPTTASMVGSGYNNIANGFVTVNATAANSSDIADLFDSALGDLYSGSGADGSMIGSNYRLNVTQFGTVNIHGASGATNRCHAPTVSYQLNKIGDWTDV